MLLIRKVPKTPRPTVICLFLSPLPLSLSVHFLSRVRSVSAVVMVEELLEASREGDSGRIERLLADGADANGKDDLGRAPLLYAAANGHMDAVEALLAAGADPGASNEAGNTPLHYASLNGHVGAVQRLIEAGARPAVNSHDRTPLDEAQRMGYREVVNALMESVAHHGGGEEGDVDEGEEGEGSDTQDMGAG